MTLVCSWSGEGLESFVSAVDGDCLKVLTSARCALKYLISSAVDIYGNYWVSGLI